MPLALAAYMLSLMAVVLAVLSEMRLRHIREGIPPRVSTPFILTIGAAFAFPCLAWFVLWPQ